MKNIVISLFLILLGCDTPRESAHKFVYTKDDRTGLCFALYAIGGNGGSMTYVPCTEEVEKQIKIDDINN